MADPPETRNAAQIAADFSAKATANEIATKENSAWFNNFVKDIPTLDRRPTNYPDWIYAIRDVCHKQTCSALLSINASTSTKLEINNSKNVNMLMMHTIHENARPFLLKTMLI